MSITLDSDVAVLFGRAHKKRDAVVKGLGVATVGDLLFRFPRTYVETHQPSTVKQLKEGDQISVVGRVLSSDLRSFTNRRTGRRGHRVEVRVATDGPRFDLVFFVARQGHGEAMQRQFRAGRLGLFTGKAKLYRESWQLSSPHAVMFDAAEAGAEGVESIADTLKGLMPVYRAPAGIESFDILKAIQFGLDVVTDVPDVLPAALRAEHDLPDVATALRLIHAPDDRAQLYRAQRRFRFEEALVTQLVLARRRAAIRALGGRSRVGEPRLLRAFDERLPFELTAAQQQVGAEIAADLAQPYAMNRLLQGEVGSGKTVVALRAMLGVVDAGAQTVLLAPTEVLAQQHYRSITNLLGDLAGGGMLGGAEEATQVVLLTGSMGKTARQAALLAIVTGEAGIVIGTHALLQDTVDFADLGLIVVDEQHRFGVEQRAALTGKSDQPPHVLVMTATPIPRTVAMTVFGDLEVSTIEQLPAGRAEIQTNVVPVKEKPTWLARVWERVAEEVAKGHQVYVVCPRITADDTPGDRAAEGADLAPLDFDEDGEPITDSGTNRPSLAAVEEVVEQLSTGPLSGLRVQPLHGKQTPETKDATMRAFAAGEVDVLVSTTVIEVGVDVANATMMVLLDADRFGVSQLHQLRGRVGRGGLPGLCLLVSHAEMESPAMERLDAVAATTDGFELSRVDLESRSEGDVLGVSQSGYRSSLRQLRVLRDEKTIVTARGVASALLAADPDLGQAPLLAEAVDTLEESSQAAYMEMS